MNRLSIVACARWETDHIEEWVRYHLFLGVDHIYLYCNDDDPTALYEAVAPYCRGTNPQITFTHYPFQGEQWKMYMDFIEKRRWETQSVCFLDIDEFLTIKGTNDINVWMSKFNSDWECLFFNWLHYGSSNHVTRSTGSVLKNYTLRERFPDHTTKVIIKTRSIDVDFMHNHASAFWHGISSSGYDCFNAGLVQYDTAGRNFPWFYEEWWRIHHAGGATEQRTMEDLSIPLLESGYVSHFFIKSTEDAQRRIARGMKGNFTNQSKWSNLDTQDKLRDFMEKYHAVEDHYLEKVWQNLNSLRPYEFFLPIISGRNVALNKPCNQSSLSEWSGCKDSPQADASGAVNGVINGMAKNHTAFDDSPWWYVDLEKPLQISMVRVFERLDPNQRFSHLVMDISNDGLVWQEVFRKDSDRRIGGMDGDPLVINFTPNCYARFVRLRVPFPSFLHFDQVEVYSPEDC